MARAHHAHPKAEYTTATDFIHLQHYRRSIDALVRGVHTRIVRPHLELGPATSIKSRESGTNVTNQMAIGVQ